MLGRIRKYTRNDYTIETSARKSGYKAFMEVYVSPYDANIFVLGHSILGSALLNNDISARIAIANKLLDDGADVTLGNPITAFLMYHAHDFDLEVPLLQRLIANGVDLNKAVGKWGTPLVTLATNFKYSDADLAPFYDVFFAQPNLDFSATVWRSKGRDSVYRQIQKVAEVRPDLLKRSDAYLVAHDQSKPADAL